MPGYPHLTRSERDQIADLNAQGLGVTAIAQAVGRHPSTISRELKRNAHADGTYRPVFAEGSYLYRRQRCAILEADAPLRGFVIDRLAEGWTPEQIAGWLRRGVEIGLRAVSHEAICAFIFRAAQKVDKLWRYLTRRKASRGRRARRSKDQIAGKTHISERSEAANTRDEAGHWEGDLVICKHNRPLLVLHERKTRLTIMTRLASKTAAETISAITGILTQLDPRMRRSMTFPSRRYKIACRAADNGGEFAKHSLLKDALKMATYFCDAYASWQKGGIENSNGRPLMVCRQTTAG